MHPERAVPPARQTHDHAPCLESALSRAETAFASRGMKLTALRRLVFEEIAGSHDAVGAYDVLDRLQRKTGERMAPISVYRALDALLDAGVVHRLESRNAFFACHSAHETAARPLALVCDQCGAVTERDAKEVRTAIDALARLDGFEPKTIVIEVSGCCGACRKAEPEGAA
jgi:Fur family transcriptional regulator, zinc uptake regulator